MHCSEIEQLIINDKNFPNIDDILKENIIGYIIKDNILNIKFFSIKINDYFKVYNYNDFTQNKISYHNLLFIIKKNKLYINE